MTMIRGETPAPTRQPSLAGDPCCESAKPGLARLLASGRTLGDEPDLRAHLSRCEDCNSIYREHLLADARMRRTLVECDAQADSSAQDPASRPRAVLSPISVARAGFSSAGRGKATWVVMLAILGYAAMRLTPEPSGVARAHLSALAGEVDAMGESVAVGGTASELERGDWVRTSEGARAQLKLGATTVEIASGSLVQVEEPSARRLRLESGSLDVHGQLVVTSCFGIVEVEDGYAVLSIDPRGLYVESTRGNVRTIDSRGEQELVGGQSAQLALAR